MPDSVLFRVQKVKVRLDDCDLPGPTRRKVACCRCGQIIRDRREIVDHDKPVCKPCSADCYFSHPREINWDGMNWSPRYEATGGADPSVEPRRNTNIIALHLAPPVLIHTTKGRSPC